jgi:hypothetical protein
MDGVLVYPENNNTITSITVASGGKLLMPYNASWSNKIILEDGAKILQQGEDTNKPTWYDDFVTYLGSASQVNQVKTYIKCYTGSNAKISNSTIVF